MKGKGSVVVEGENLVQRHAERPGDAEGKVKGRGVFAVLDGKDGLAGDTDAVGEVFLRHLACIKAQAADAIFDMGHRQAPRR